MMHLLEYSTLIRCQTRMPSFSIGMETGYCGVQCTEYCQCQLNTFMLIYLKLSETLPQEAMRFYQFFRIRKSI